MGEAVGETGMDGYAFYSYTGDDLLDLEADLLPMPVRREMEKAVFGGGEVRMDLLIDELYLFLTEHPDRWDLYAGTLEALTYLAGVNLGMEGDTEAAAQFLEMSLEANPASLPLRTDYALVLQLEGRGEEALEQCEIILADPEGVKNPMVCMLVARLYAEEGQYVEAYRLLEGKEDSFPDDDAFREFLAEMKELAGMGDEAVEEETPVSVCPACGRPVQPGTKFCGKCGMEIEGEAPRGDVPPTFCPGCGTRIREGARFCNECGRTL